MTARRFNSESSESTNEKSRMERDEGWDAMDKYKSNRDGRNYGPKHTTYYETDRNRQYYDKR